MSPVHGKTFVLELARSIRFKAKQELINYLREQNAQISFILTASTDYVLVSDDVDTYKTRRAKQLGIPLVNVAYVYECQKWQPEKEPIDVKRFMVTSAEDKENFSKTGTIPVSGGGVSPTGATKPAKLDLSKVKIWNSDDSLLPQFDELTHAEIGKWAIFKETNDHADVYFALELQIIPEEYYKQEENAYRFRFRYEKQTISHTQGKPSSIQYAFSDDIHELHQLFATYYYRIATMPRITRLRDLLPDKLGSKLLLKSLFLHRFDTHTLDEHVCQLIESLWVESIGDLDKMLSIQPESITLKTIIEAEAALLEIQSNSKSSSEAQARFYALIPHRPTFVVGLVENRHALIEKVDLCQMLRDMLTVNELTNWNVKASIEAKYRALKCHIETIEQQTQEYQRLAQMISSSTNQNEQVIVHQIYSIAKQADAIHFRSSLFNQKSLFHGSKYKNFLGILSRGLLMPKVVVNDLGITRTDIGCLGYGIYFSDSVSTSLKYTTASETRPGRRLLCISQVALGNSAKFYSYSSTLTQAPDNCHSTHGVKRNGENNSKFVDDEYAIYNLDQQRLLYLVEVSWLPHDDVHRISRNVLPIIRQQANDRSIASSDLKSIPLTMEDEVIQVAEQDYGLICPSSGQLVPLRAFHVRAQLVDVTAEVVFFQVYHNTSAVPIEAKYVFPLDENCSVCGFEAHINNKIIKGVVKEKEQAKREYREAIEKGHGAYLMHQEQPEVFSVAIGNLPANCEVVIKITYVAELSIENHDIIFRLPAKVASWQSKQALEMKDQTIVPLIELQRDDPSLNAVQFSLKASIRMPYEIMKLFSPTHRLRRKLTDCVAMIELVDNVLLEKDFILSITLKSVHVPRLLNETWTLNDENNNASLLDEPSQASMLTFYPKFETASNANECVELVFLIDVSNSMDGKHVQQAKQLAHLFLTQMNAEQGLIHFNIVTFGSDNDECFPISSANTKENLDKAKHFVLHSLDHRGNTDLLSVLRQYSLLPSPSKLGRQFILLSDGHINELASILALLAAQPSMRHDRFFTCSIGDVSSKHHLKQLANGATGGGLSTVFDSNYRSRWKSKALDLLEHVRQPCVTNIQIEWHGNLDRQQETLTCQAPRIIRSLFNGMRLTVYRFIQNCHKATLTATINEQEFVTTIFSGKMTETKGRILHCLTARAIIQDYENGLLHQDETENELMKTKYKQDLIELSMKYSVVSSFTSFVAIEERDGQALEPGVRLLDVMLEHDLDVLPYIGWDGDRSQIDMIKEKLINAKQALLSAPVSRKIDLSMEFESLCQKVSYRAGGEAKYDLMLALIDTYKSASSEKEKAHTLERKLRSDLTDELAGATGDERKGLEKRLNEINVCIDQGDLELLEDQRMVLYRTCTEPLAPAESSSSSLYSEEDEPTLDAELGGGGGDAKYSPTYGDSMLSKIAMRREMNECEYDFDEVGSDLFVEASSTSTRNVKAEERKEAEESDDCDDDMGFCTFDPDNPVYTTRSRALEQTANLAAQASPSYEPTSPAYSPISPCVEQEEDMGFAFEDWYSAIEAQSSVKKADDQPSRCDEPNRDKSMNSVVSTNSLSDRPTPLTKLMRQNISLSQILERGEKLEGLNQLQAHQIYPSSTGFAEKAEKKAKKASIFNAATPAAVQQVANQPTATFSFGNSSNTSGSSLFGGFGASATVPTGSTAGSFSFGAPPSAGSSSLFGAPATSTTAFGGSSNTHDLRTQMGFYMPTTGVASTVPPPPTPAAFSFGTGPTFDSSSLFETSAVCTTAFSVAEGSSLFGSSYHTSSLYTPEGFGMPAAVPPPPPPLPAPAASFSFVPASTSRSSSLFGASTVSTAPFVVPTLPPPFPLFAQHSQSTSITADPPITRGFGMASPSSTLSASLSFDTSSDVDGSTPMFDSLRKSEAATYTVPAQSLPPPPPPVASSVSYKMSAKSARSTPLNSVSNALRSPLASVGAMGAKAASLFTNVMSTAQNRAMPKSDSTSTLSFNAVDIPTTIPSHAQAPDSQSVGLGMGGAQRHRRIRTAETTQSSWKYSFMRSIPDLLHDSDSRADEIESNVRLHERGERLDDLMEASDRSMDYSNAFSRESSPTTSTDSRRDARAGAAREQQSRLLTEALSKSDSLCDLMSFDVENEMDSVADKHIERRKQTKKKRFSPATEPSIMQDLLLLDVTPLGVGIEDFNGQMCIVIPRNLTIPAKKEFYPIFTNAYASQTTATIRIFFGEHKLTKYNIFEGEFILTGLTPNFTSQTLEISICMDIDANGVLTVTAEEPRSGAKASTTIDPQKNRLTSDEINRHVAFVNSDPSFRASSAADRRPDEPLYMLKGQTEQTSINFTAEPMVSTTLPTFVQSKNFSLTSNVMQQLKRMQQPDGSFHLNEDFATLLLIDPSHFTQLKLYLSTPSFTSLAPNTQTDIHRLIATGILLIQLFLQVPTKERDQLLMPFDSERIRAILQRHLPKGLSAHVDRAVAFFGEKRSRCGIYCEQLSMNYSTWEKFIQCGLFQMNPSSF